MTLADAESVAALVRHAFAAQSVVTDPPPSAVKLTAEDVATPLRRGGGGAVARIGPDLAGAALWEAKEGGLYVGRLGIAPAFRRRGIARALLAAAEDATLASGLPTLWLETRLVLTDNRALFRSAGFIETSRHAHPGYDHPTFVRMVKTLHPGAR